MLQNHVDRRQVTQLLCEIIKLPSLWFFQNRRHKDYPESNLRGTSEADVLILEGPLLHEIPFLNSSIITMQSAVLETR